MPEARPALAAVAAAALLAGCGGEGRDGLAGTVTRVADGDTLVVRLEDGARERVRVLGVDTPELGDCGADEAAAATRALALGRDVSLQGDDTQARRDRFGRLLAYVELPDGRDLGLELLRRGLARVYAYGRRPFRRVRTYRRAATEGRDRAPACLAAAGDQAVHTAYAVMVTFTPAAAAVRTAVADHVPPTPALVG